MERRRAGSRIQISAKPDLGVVEAWRPKDHDSRVAPVPAGAIDLLTRMHASVPEGSVYLFLSPERVVWIQTRRAAGTWKEEQRTLNNTPRDFRLIAKTAKVPDVSLHDLRRSAITHWARKLPAPVIQELAGHADIKTTLKYYITVRHDDMELARDAIEEALTPTSSADGPKMDPNEASAV